MSGPFKMKGWSPFTQKIHPKHSVTPPTKEESKKSKGELFERDLTGFRRYDRKGTKAEQKALKAARLSQWERTKKRVKSQIKEGTFWGWPIDKWGGGKR